MIDRVFLPAAPRPQHHRRDPDSFRVHMGDVAFLIRLNFHRIGRLRKFFRMINIAAVPALALHHGLQGLQPPAVSDGILSQFPALFDGSRLGHVQHICGKIDAHLCQVSRPPALQHLNRLLHLQRISHRMSQRNIHICDQGTAVTARMGSDGHHLLCQPDGILKSLHKCPASGLDVQHDSVAPGSDLFAHNRGGDKRNAVHCGRDIPQGIQLFIRRNQIAGLADDSGSRLVDDAEKFFPGNRRLKAWNALQLVDSPSRMSQPAAGHFCHLHTVGCDNGDNHQSRLISHAPGTVLISLNPLDRRQVHHVPGSCHLHGQLRRLPVRHPSKVNRHQHGRHLVVRNLAVHKSPNHIGNLFP